MLEQVAKMLGVPAWSGRESRIKDLESAQAQADVALAEAISAKEAALLAVENGDQQADKRLKAAQHDFDVASRARADIQEHLRAARIAAERRAALTAKQARESSWQKADKINEQRLEHAAKLTAALQEAGKHFAALRDLSSQAFLAMPVRNGDPAAFRLGARDLEGVVGLELQRAGLPDAARISPSMLSQYPTVVDVVNVGVDLVRQARAADGGIA